MIKIVISFKVKKENACIYRVKLSLLFYFPNNPDGGENIKSKKLKKFFLRIE